MRAMEMITMPLPEHFGEGTRRAKANLFATSFDASPYKFFPKYNIKCSDPPPAYGLWGRS